MAGDIDLNDEDGLTATEDFVGSEGFEAGVDFVDGLDCIEVEVVSCCEAVVCTEGKEFIGVVGCNEGDGFIKEEGCSGGFIKDVGSSDIEGSTEDVFKSVADDGTV